MKEFRNISLPGSALPEVAQPVVSVPAHCAEAEATLSVSASHEGAYRVCKHFSDFFYTVKSELVRAARILRNVFRPWRKTPQFLPAACCGYSRTILGWRL